MLLRKNSNEHFDQPKGCNISCCKGLNNTECHYHSFTSFPQPPYSLKGIGLLWCLGGKNHRPLQETQVRSLVLEDPMCQPPLFLGFPRQEYLSGLPFPFPGDLTDPRIELTSPALAGGFFSTMPPGKPDITVYNSRKEGFPSLIFLPYKQ